MKLKKFRDLLEYIKKNKFELAFITIITLLAVLLRVIVMNNHQYLILDELYSWYFAKQDSVFRTIFELTKQDVHEPFYFVILHLWIKLFGDSEKSMQFCTLLTFIPTIPLSFQVSKKIFNNKILGYLVALSLMMNQYCLSNSTQVRFYGILYLLPLIVAYYFTQMCLTKEKKYYIAFGISSLLLLYTFTLAPLLIFSCFVVGLLYLLKENKQEIKNYLKYNFCFFIGAIPAFLIMIYNYFKVHNSVCALLDLHRGNSNFNTFLDMLASLFSQDSRQSLIFDQFPNFIQASFTNPLTLVVVGIPACIGIFGLIRTLLSKDKKIYLFFLPSLLFLLAASFLSYLGKIVFIGRYSIIIFVVFLIAGYFGITNFKNKIISIIFAIIVLFFNLLYYILSPNILALDLNDSESLGAISVVSDRLIRDNDTVIIPYSSKRVKYYINHGNVIDDFNIDDALILNDEKSKEFYFGKEISSKLTRDNIADSLIEYKNKPYENYEQELTNYFNKMKPKDRFVLIDWRQVYTTSLRNSYNMFSDSDFKNDLMLVFWIYIYKSSKDTFEIANKNLKLIYNQHFKDFDILIWEK